MRFNLKQLLTDEQILIGIAFFRPSSEPEISLRHGTQGSETSTISIPRSGRPQSGGPRGDDDDPHRGEYRTDLPGPSQVVTDPGNCGKNPLTGQRQRRRGVSGPPTGD